MTSSLPTCVGIALLVISTAACGADTEVHVRPNVLVFIMDTVRGDRCSVNGYGAPTTPYLEELGRESTVFTRAWSPSCWTGPAHASLFTGLRPEHHGFLAGSRFELDEGATTLAEILRDRGYETGFVNTNPTVSKELGLTQGFTTEAFLPEVRGDRTPPSRRATARALAFVRDSRRKRRPFFLFVNNWDAHVSYNPPEETAHRFLPPDAHPEEVRAARKFVAGMPELLGDACRDFTPRQWLILSALYDGEIATVDAEVRRLVEGIREEGLLDDTLVVITSDHGENLGERGRCGHFMSLSRTVLYIPLLVRFPRAFPAGQRRGETVRLEDVFPTVLAACGIEEPEPVDGRPLQNDEGDRPARAVLGGLVNAAIERDYPEFVSSQRWRPLRSAFDGRYHLIERNDGRTEFYDVASDPTETKDLAGRAGEAFERMRDLLPSSPFFR